MAHYYFDIKLDKSQQRFSIATIENSMGFPDKKSKNKATIGSITSTPGYPKRQQKIHAPQYTFTLMFIAIYTAKIQKQPD